MDWILIVGCVVWIVMLALFAPEMFAPRCPFCGSILERRPAEKEHSWMSWMSAGSNSFAIAVAILIGALS